MSLKYTLDMHLPNSTGGWTLAQAMESMKRNNLTRLLASPTDEEISEQAGEFERDLRDGETPTAGGVLAAYYLAVLELLEHQLYTEDSINNRQYGQRLAAAKRLVFRNPR